MMRPSHCCIMVMTIVVMAVSRSYTMQVKNSYRDIDNDRLRNINMEPITETFVICSTNNCFKLNDNLNLLEITAIGLNGSCYSHVIGRKSVMFCSFTNGICVVRSLSDLTSVLYSHPKPIVPKSNIHGVHSMHSNTNKIYVANSFLYQEILSNNVPLISSRSAHNLHLFHQDSIGSSAKFLNLDIIHQHPSFFITYVYTFTHEGYVYFISRRPYIRAQMEKKVFSTISRVCVDDKYFRSFVEIPLDCFQDSDIRYSLAMAAHYNPSLQLVFVSFSDNNNENDASSTVCQFTLLDVNNKMNETVQDCYHGHGSLGPQHIIKAKPCVSTTAEPDLCGHSEVANNYSSIEGMIPVFGHPLITLPYVHITTLICWTENEYTIIYLGTWNGSLKKVTINDRGQVTIASDIVLDYGHQVIHPIFINRNGDSLYAMTESKLMKIDTDHCQEKTTCQQCTALLDSLCGWCVLENRCTKKSKCPSVELYPQWLPSKNGVCVDMEIYPNIVSYQTTNNLQIFLKLNWIAVNDNSTGDLHCNFKVMNTEHETIATVNGSTIICPLPANRKLPSMPTGLDHGIYEVEFQIKGKTIVKRDVTWYNCGLNQNCTGCTESIFNCKWCHLRGLCVEATSSECQNINKTVPAIASSSDCPRLEISSQDTDVVIHSGRNRSISVRVANLKSDQWDNVHCLFTYNNEVKFVKGEVMSSNLQCEHHLFEYMDASLPIVTAVFMVTAGPNSVPLDNPQNIKVHIYKCGPMVTNCGQCLSMDPEYECGWCMAGIPQCSLQSDCLSTDWLDRAAICPEPQVLRFNPMTGPVQGRTNISVTGLNLGKSYKDLQVWVADLFCPVQPYQYESSQRFQCQIVGPKISKSGIIRVTVSMKYDTDTGGHFEFVDPEVSGLSPLYGPLSGGTTLTVSGMYMNTGSMITVEVGGVLCEVVSSEMSTLTCVTPQQTSNSDKVDVEVNFGDLRKLVPVKFTYIQDPTISQIEPKISILSGGTNIIVIGSQMQVLQKPELFVEVDGLKITTDCIVNSSTSLFCKAPSLSFLLENVTVTSPKEVHYGFNLDGVIVYRNISTDPKFGPLLYYPNPDVDNFPLSGHGGKKFETGHIMVIKGNFRHINPIMHDVEILVGGSLCAITIAADNSLSCKAPEHPKEVDNNGNAVVMLHIGNMKTKVGHILYYEKKDEEKPMAIGIILGVVLPIIAIIVLLAVCVYRRHITHKPSDNYIPDVWKEEGKGDEEEGMEMNHVAVKADMNGSIPDDKDMEPYVEELISHVEDDVSKHNIKQMLISRKQLHIGDLLGNGNFGSTYKATYSESDEDNPNDVVVKTVHGSLFDSESIAKFLQTMAHLHNLQHPGLVPVQYICISLSQDPMVVMPYSQNGDLKTFVRDSNKSLTMLKLLDYAHQIAEAMNYLATHSVVHGNLALRNCLMSDQKNVLIGDYELWKDLFKKDNFTKEVDKNKSLVKWTAPEVIEGEDLTAKSDVWSYGIVLWELLTRGVSPYPNMENSEIVAYVKAGNRMRKPKQCPEDVYNLMLRCWHLMPFSRPTFHEITVEVQRFVSAEHKDASLEEETTPLKNNITSTEEEEDIV